MGIQWKMGKQWKQCQTLCLGGSKITIDGDCSHEIKRRLLLGSKVMTNLDSILKSRDITLSTKVHLVKAMIFPVVMYGCESWTVKKAEHQRIDAFELWFWRRLLGVPWTARRSNQSVLKEISPGCSLEGLMPKLKLKLQYFGRLIQQVDSLEKTLMLRGIGDRRRRGWQKMRWLDGITNSMGMGLGRFQKLVMDREAWRAAIHGVSKTPWATELNWTELNWNMHGNMHKFSKASLIPLCHISPLYVERKGYIKRFFFLNVSIIMVNNGSLVYKRRNSISNCFKVQLWISLWSEESHDL